MERSWLGDCIEVVESRNPATGQALATLKSPTPADIAQIFARAERAQRAWGAMSLHRRAKTILRVRQRLVERADEIVDLISLENGKPKFEALSNEVLPVIQQMTLFVARAPSLLQDQPISITNPFLPHRRSYLNYAPLGTILIISPWNYPFMLPMAEIVMALLAGNAVILKPSEVTPLVGLEISKLFALGGLDPDLVQTVVGSGKTGQALIAGAEGRKPAKIFFTGSPLTGRKIMAQAAEKLTPVNLELGGKDAMIILDDADLDFASSVAVYGSFANSGQVCASTQRLIIHESIAQDFVTRFVEKTRRLRIGVDQGPITAERQRLVYVRQIEEARKKSVTFNVGGDFDGRSPHCPPTLATGAQIESTALFNEETFGPFVAMTTFANDEEAITKANCTPYGLGASVIGSDLRRAEAVARKINAGTIDVNEVLYTAGIGETPWGGWGETGFGVKHSDRGFFEFVRTRHIHAPRARAFQWKSWWWFPYTKIQYWAFREVVKLYDSRWIRRMVVFPKFVFRFLQFLLADRRT